MFAKMPEAQIPIDDTTPVSSIRAAAVDRNRDIQCRYDTTFDSVSGEGSEEIALEDYIVWVLHTQPAAAKNSTLLARWVEHFHSYDANGDGKLDFGEMHRPSKAGKAT